MRGVRFVSASPLRSDHAPEEGASVRTGRFDVLHQRVAPAAVDLGPGGCPRIDHVHRFRQKVLGLANARPARPAPSPPPLSPPWSPGFQTRRGPRSHAANRGVEELNSRDSRWFSLRGGPLRKTFGNQQKLLASRDRVGYPAATRPAPRLACHTRSHVRTLCAAQTRLFCCCCNKTHARNLRGSEERVVYWVCGVVQ